MPLKKGTSRETIGQNIRELQESGDFTRPQAAAIAFKAARRSGKKSERPPVPGPVRKNLNRLMKKGK